MARNKLKAPPEERINVKAHTRGRRPPPPPAPPPSGFGIASPPGEANEPDEDDLEGGM